LDDLQPAGHLLVPAALSGQRQSSGGGADGVNDLDSSTGRRAPTTSFWSGSDRLIAALERPHGIAAGPIADSV